MTSAVNAVGIDSHPLTTVSPRFQMVLRRFSRTMISSGRKGPAPLYRTSVALFLRRLTSGGSPEEESLHESADRYELCRRGAARREQSGSGANPDSEQCGS